MESSINKVLIVEDHAEAAKVLADVVKLKFDNPEVTITGTIASGFKYLNADSFDMALLDIGLPDGCGIDLVRHINIYSEKTLSIVTTIFDDEKHLFEALQAGACGYLLKGYSAEELGKYLNEAVEGKPPLSPDVAQSVLTYFRETDAKPEPTAELDQIDLSERETEILTFIAKGYQVKEVSELLEISANTVAFHIKKIYKKLNIHNRAEATAAAVNRDLYKPE
ncbi:MAG: DNA-binding NarL/FixJ family response regulator [Chitinophagales bacterium]|jgi:DNA-binding NarL/FixJ family response regulator